jgi:hypothetical protein
MKKELYIESWTQLLFLTKQYNSKIHSLSGEVDIKKLNYPLFITIVGNEREQFIWV